MAKMLIGWYILLFFSAIGADTDCGSLNSGGPFNGTATFFSNAASIISAGSGKCMLTSDDTMVAGRPAVDFDNSEVCGQCIEVTGPNGDNVTVRVIDECRDCPADGLNLSEEAFQILESNLVTGRIDITWSIVQCSITDNIQYRFKEGSSKYWFGIQAVDHLYPIDTMQVRESGSSNWVTLERQGYNFFLKPSSVTVLDAPFDIKLTSTNGFIVEDTINQIRSSESEYIAGSSQFETCDEGVTPAAGVTDAAVTQASGETDTTTSGASTVNDGATEGAVTSAAACAIDDQVHHGEGTYYLEAGQAAAGTGTCMLIHDDLMVGAMAISSWANSQVCGECVEVTGPYGDVINIKIIDQCPTCPGSGDIDFSLEAFEILAPRVEGRIDISWRVIECQTSGNFKYKFKSGSTKWWFGIQVNNHRYPVSRMQLKPTGSSSWMELERTYYNFFLKPSGSSTIDVPFDIRVISTTGVMVEDTISQFLSSESQLLEGSTQFPDCDGSSGPAVTVTEHGHDYTPTPLPANEELVAVMTSYEDGMCLVDETVHTGEGTYYMGAPQAAAGSGTCMMNTYGFLDVGAMAIGSWRNSETCGECIQVTGPYGDTVYIIIIDQCPSCATDDIDLSLQAFEKIAPIRDGRIEISWKVVECPFTDTIKYKFKDGSTKWWFGIQIVYHRLPVVSVAVKPDDEDTWIELTRSTYNFFLQDQRIVDVPFSIRVTGSSGEVLEDRITYFPSSMSDLIDGNVQFSTTCIGGDLFEESDHNSVTMIMAATRVSILVPFLSGLYYML